MITILWHGCRESLALPACLSSSYSMGLRQRLAFFFASQPNVFGDMGLLHEPRVVVRAGASEDYGEQVWHKVPVCHNSDCTNMHPNGLIMMRCRASSSADGCSVNNVEST